MLFLCYPKCSTCRKAQSWLDGHGISYELRDIKLNHPTAGELTDWYRKSGLPLKKFFNTSGLQYKALGLKDKCPKLIIIQEGTSYRIELKEQTEPEDLEKEITAFLKRNGGKVDNLSLVLEQLKKKHPNFNLSDYGYSRISSFLRSFDKIAVHGNALMLKDEGRRK